MTNQEIKRYELTDGNYAWYSRPHMVEDQFGEWVDYKVHQAVVESMQAKIDALMLEFCPSRMTNVQAEEYALHQKSFDEWTPWNGGTCPLPPKTDVQVRLKNGLETVSGSSSGWFWGHRQCGDDIIAYRVVK